MKHWEEFKKFCMPEYKTVKKNKSNYADIAFSFDIETSSFFVKGGKAFTNAEYEKEARRNPKAEADYTKCGLCYIWQFAVDTEEVFYGRKLSEFTQFLDVLAEKLCGRRAIIFVHNLSYEFQFIYKFFAWDSVFALDNRKVMYAKTGQFDFRCSYLLSAKSLSGVSKEISSVYPEYGKKDGDLDYSLLRHEETPLTKAEMGYCEMDVLTVCAYVNTQREIYGSVVKLPYTNTGRVRKLCRDNCFKNKRYRLFIHDLNVTPLEFKMARCAFSGGYVHANALYSGETVENVSSYDFTSSYPYVMLSEKYPMSSGLEYPKERITEKVFNRYCERYLAIVAVTFSGVRVKDGLQAIISSSKCSSIKGGTYDNGKVFSAEELQTVVTNIELENIKRFYDIKKLKLGKAIFYKADYLPKEYVETIFDLYEAKTKLKDLKGKTDEETLQIEREYMLKKNMLNSLYGMMVFNPIKDEYVFNSENDEWEKVDVEINEERIFDMNEDKSRFTFYLWGVFVTAYARNNLYSSLLECKRDFVYSDTDSVKIINAERHKDYFSRYDKSVVEKLLKMCKTLGVPFERCEPKNVKGKKKLLGIWDFEGVYSRFKTLGAKRYLTEKDGGLDLTISGVNKRKALPYLLEKYKDNSGVFEAFNDSLYIPKEHTGKSIHAYIDEAQEMRVTDYRGKEKLCRSESGVHLIESDYSLSILQVYADFLRFAQRKGAQ